MVGQKHGQPRVPLTLSQQHFEAVLAEMEEERYHQVQEAKRRLEEIEAIKVQECFFTFSPLCDNGRMTAKDIRIFWETSVLSWTVWPNELWKIVMQAEHLYVHIMCNSIFMISRKHPQGRSNGLKGGGTPKFRLAPSALAWASPGNFSRRGTTASQNI